LQPIHLCYYSWQVIEPEPLQQIDRTYVLWRGKKLSYFSGCDYFRLSSHPKVLRALADGLKRFGLSVAASRLTTGNHSLYDRLEERLARFFQVEAALLVPTGYVANLAVAQALAGHYSHVLIDEAAHPSLRDASKMLECPVLHFRHQSAADLACAVRRCGPGSKLIVLTDGLFSRDGSVAPLKEYLGILPRDAMILVDDAHGTGVVGTNGRGSAEHTGATGRLIQTVTLSKALGVYGGAILGSRSLRQKVLKRSQLFVGSTPLPLPLAGAALQALAILETDRALRSRLVVNTATLRCSLSKAGVFIPPTPGPIISLTPNHTSAAAKMKRVLFRAGVYPPFIQYPGGPESGYFRFVISSEHSSDQLGNLARVLIRTANLFVPLSLKVAN
jgi:8-amino-7-oxononanoate synthase